MKTPLQAARHARGWSQARAVWELTRLAQQKGIKVASDASLKTQLSRWENGHITPDFYRPLLCELFGSTPREIGFATQKSASEFTWESVEERLDSRTLADLADISLLGNIRDQAPDQPNLDAESFASVLTGDATSIAPECCEITTDIETLAVAARDARSHYQACHYSELIRQLPQLLHLLQAACISFEGEAKSRALALMADVYHVAAGLLLKLDDKGLAYLAADRSMQAALANGDPITIGASARIITHALMNGGHMEAAVSVTKSQAQRLVGQPHFAS